MVNMYIIIFGIAMIIIIPIAFLVGASAYMRILGTLIVLGLLGFGLYYAYWYLFKRKE